MLSYLCQGYFCVSKRNEPDWMDSKLFHFPAIEDNIVHSMAQDKQGA